MKRRAGFSLIEIMGVLTIISILTALGVVNFNEARKRARDVDRQADLRTLQSAVELYKQKNGRYPAGCKAVGQWSGQTGTNYACASGNQYIVNLAPEFIPALPKETQLNGVDSGYVYTTNTDGTVYKIEARKTVESETVSRTHTFSSCDRNTSSHVDGGMCVNSGGSTPIHCQDADTVFQSSYAVWGGYANQSSAALVEQGTEDVICDIP